MSKQIKSLSIDGNNILLGGSSAISGDIENNSTIIGQGTTEGKYSIAVGLGTDNEEGMAAIKNLVWPTNSGTPIKLPPAQALGNMSTAVGPGTVAYTPGATAIGIESKAGAKGFYWWDDYDDSTVCDVLVPLAIEQEHFYLNADALEYGIYVLGSDNNDTGYLRIVKNYEEENVIALATIGEDTQSDGPYYSLYLSAEELVEAGFDTNTKYTFTEDYLDSSTIGSIYITRSGYQLNLSSTQPRISYGDSSYTDTLESITYEDGSVVWKQVRDWCSDYSEYLIGNDEGVTGWKPIPYTDSNGKNQVDYAVTCFYGGHKHSFCSTVLDANGEEGYVILDFIPDPWQSSNGEPVSVIQWDEYLIFCPRRPESGIVDAGLNGFALGQGTTASGQSVFAQGFGSCAGGSYAVATGIDTEAGYAAFAMGSHSKAHGLYAFAGGNESISSHDNTFAFGNECNATHKQAVAMGNKCSAGFRSVAMGAACTAKGGTVDDVKTSVAIGRGLIAESDQYAFGKFNDNTNSNALFMVGNGTGTSASKRKNALVIDKDGTARFSGNVYVGSSTAGDIVATQSYVSDVLESYVSDDMLAWDYISGTPDFKFDAGTGIAFGASSTATGGNSIAVGNNCHTSAIKYNKNTEDFESSSTSFSGAAVFGTNNNAYRNNQLVIGGYCDNTEGILQDKLFVIGFGTKSTRKNIHTVNEAGNAWYAGSVTANSLVVGGNTYSRAIKLKITYGTGSSATTETVTLLGV